MAQTFFPEPNLIKRIPASPPHENAEYVISVGSEFWDGIPQRVVKIQMAYDGKISGRRSPSYPIGTDDYERVFTEVKKLVQT